MKEYKGWELIKALSELRNNSRLVFMGGIDKLVNKVTK